MIRLVVETALIRRDGLNYSSWVCRSNSPSEVGDNELPLESKVSEVIGNMQILCLAVEDQPGSDSMRGFIERNSIFVTARPIMGEYLRFPIYSFGWMGSDSLRLFDAKI
ncbi:MAG: hypothetical protein OXE56_09060 [Gammaproteobacteria bacterium]|nr:hypothetical protein [Gammaproteobacteria bacterium]